ncbi:hypothetical protein EXIGLDRAFT_717910 [Exidia glandulosa HHB12029]|uniref:F-box domain-containing protein n=1 Tax=Exidia glandulosa HHB12029 TaxID=1314781 RepID=A0A165P102_EXIGL|nr:hypothetical protein EXIGLDRAFT_717910 [Exidia glandulosa HHB12029]
MHETHTPRLPPELLGAAFAYLEQPDILRAAAVCALWRGEAHRSSNYYQHIQYGTHFDWEPPGCRGLPLTADAKSFALAMQTAGDDDSIQRLSVAICIAFRYTIEDHEWFDDLDLRSDSITKYRSVSHLVRTFIAPSLHKCMGKVHRLDIDAGGSVFKEMLPALRQPAPRLTRCRLTARPEFYIDNTVPISPELFGGHAPLLADISLYRDVAGDMFGDIVLDTPVPAFAHAVRLSLQAQSVTRLANLPSFFPSLRHLELVSREYPQAEPQALAPGDYENLARPLRTVTLQLRTYHTSLLEIWEDFIAAMHAVQTLRVDLSGQRGKSFARPLFEHLCDMPGLEVRIHRMQMLRDDQPIYELRLRAAPSNRERTVQGSRDMVSAYVTYLAVVQANITELRLPREFLDTCRDLIDRLPSPAALHVLRSQGDE